MIAKNDDHSRYHTEKFSTMFFLVEIHASVNNQPLLGLFNTFFKLP